MTCRKSKRHLEFDPLESMELLSGTGMSLPHAMIPPHHVPQLAQVHRMTKGPVPGVPLNLSGTVQGTYRIVSGRSEASFSGRGNLSPVGNVRLQGMVALTVSANSGQLTFNLGSRGKIFVSVVGATPGVSYDYRIAGGTRSFAGDTGTGVAVADFTPSNIHRGHFSLALAGGPVPPA